MRMEGHSAYYHQQMYPRDGYGGGAPIPGAYQHPPACIYQHNTSDHGNYGGQAMQVVDQSVLNESPNTYSHQMSSHGLSNGPTPGHAPIANTTPAHMQNSHQLSGAPVMPQVTQPPPAHSQQPPATPQVSSASGNGGNGQQTTGNGSTNHLQFPWMKTTKSHAHQWKAQWPGMPEINYV